MEGDSSALEHLLEAISAEEMDVDLRSINPNTPLRKAGLDSLDFFNLIMAIENIYGIVVADEDLENLNTLNQIATYLECRQL